MSFDVYEYIGEIGIDPKKVIVDSLDQVDKRLLKTYSEKSGMLVNISNLFESYLHNRNLLKEKFNITVGDFIYLKDKRIKEKDKLLLFNTLFNNLLSSGKMFVDEVQRFIDKYNIETKSFISDIYDDFFQYRFLYQMRNFTQHGHFAVSEDFDGSYYFNLPSIVSELHFNFNKKVKKEMKDFSDLVEKEIKVSPKLAFTSTYIVYNYCIALIYNLFFSLEIKNIMYSYNMKEMVIKANKGLIYKSKDYYNGIVIYEIKDGCYHAFNYKDAFIKSLRNSIKKSRSELKKAEKERSDYFPELDL